MERDGKGQDLAKSETMPREELLRMIKPGFREQYVELLGEVEYDRFLQAALQWPRKSIRVNTLKIRVDALRARLEAKGWRLEPVPWLWERTS